MSRSTTLRGASAEAFAALTDQLGSQRTLGESAQLGEQLFGAAGVLRREAALRRAATDPSVESEARSGLAKAVFGSAIEGKALDLVAAAAGSRWTSSGDLPFALEQLGAQATVASAGAQSVQVGDELFAVRRLVDDNPDLRSALSDPSRSSEERAALLHGLLEGKVQDATLALVDRAVAARGTLAGELRRFELVAADANHLRLATVRTAQELSDDERRRLEAALGRQYHGEVHLHVVVEPELVGGLRIEIGDDVIDGTVVSRLHDARRRLAG